MARYLGYSLRGFPICKDTKQKYSNILNSKKTANTFKNTAYPYASGKYIILIFATRASFGLLPFKNAIMRKPDREKETSEIIWGILQLPRPDSVLHSQIHKTSSFMETKRRRGFLKYDNSTYVNLGLSLTSGLISSSSLK